MSVSKRWSYWLPVADRSHVPPQLLVLAVFFVVFSFFPIDAMGQNRKALLTFRDGVEEGDSLRLAGPQGNGSGAAQGRTLSAAAHGDTLGGDDRGRECESRH